MEEIAFLNGRFMPLSEACVSVNDRGFLFGDSVYEVMRVYGGRVWAADRHLNRLARSLEALEIKGIDIPSLREQMLEAHNRSGLTEATIYVHITRGVAPRAHVPRGELVPTVLITVRPPDPAPVERWRDGAEVVLVPEIRWARRDIKSTNLLPNCLAKRDAQLRGAHEAVFVTDEGWVDEGTSTNVFIVQGNIVRTPSNGPSLLPGVTRDLVLETARREGLVTEELPVTREALLAADEVFLTGTSTEVMGVVRVDGQPIGTGQVGPITRRLHDAYRARVAAGDDA